MQLLVDPAMPLKALGETVRQVLQQSFGAI
jgi:hypothetical protein